MNFQLAVVENVISNTGEKLTTSAVLINESYIISPIFVALQIIEKCNCNLNFSGIKYLKISPLNGKTALKIHLKHKQIANIYNSNIIAVIACEKASNVLNKQLKSWNFQLDDTKNSNDIPVSFVVIRINNSNNDFINSLKEWFNVIKGKLVQKGDEIFIKSAPFGHISLMGNESRGIVSNILGNFIFSDCPTTPGSQGSPVFLTDFHRIPIGVVLFPLCWWKGVWTGLTLVLDIRPFLLEVLQVEYTLNNFNGDCKLLRAIESGLLLVDCQTQWGSAVLLDQQRGILVTNSHVVDSCFEKTKLFWRGHSLEANIIYRTPPDEVYDLAVLQSHSNILKSSHFKSVRFCESAPKLGDVVYAAGFALFPKQFNPKPTLTKGNVSQISRSMLKTTCCINPGMSGGAVFNSNGELVAIIVCNVKLNQDYYPRFNMAVPVLAVSSIFQQFFRDFDVKILDQLWCKEPEITRDWSNFGAKL